MRHLTPLQTWDYLQAHPEALFVDVRMTVEYLYVGHPPGVVHVPWTDGLEALPDPERFVADLLRESGPDRARPIVLICRSGQRTLSAGQALEAAGFSDVINVLHGFEGDLCRTRHHRSVLNGWRHDGLPWEQM